MTIANDHRRKILAKLKKLDMSRSELARRAGVSRKALINFLNDVQAQGTGNPSVGWLDRLHDALKKR